MRTKQHTFDDVNAASAQICSGVPFLAIRLACPDWAPPKTSRQVYAPVAPTPEMLDQVASLPGRVEHIVAPSLSPEHWLYVNAFASHHPDATVWVCPGERRGGARGWPGSVGP
jgi:hypothetical protein